MVRQTEVVFMVVFISSTTEENKDHIILLRRTTYEYYLCLSYHFSVNFMWFLYLLFHLISYLEF
jgi:hypothetical protein